MKWIIDRERVREKKTTVLRELVQKGYLTQAFPHVLARYKKKSDSRAWEGIEYRGPQTPTSQYTLFPTLINEALWGPVTNETVLQQCPKICCKFFILTHGKLWRWPTVSRFNTFRVSNTLTTIYYRIFNISLNALQHIRTRTENSFFLLFNRPILIKIFPTVIKANFTTIILYTFQLSSHSN